MAWVCIEGTPAGAVLLRDPLRRHAPCTMRRLHDAGLKRLVMLTGNRAEPAREVATGEMYVGPTPAAAVWSRRERAVTMMVGDGINDASALADATVGVAITARGATASSKDADIVLTTDRLNRLANTTDIARWSRRIAVQSAVLGMSLSLVAMVVAALGWLPGDTKSLERPAGYATAPSGRRVENLGHLNGIAGISVPPDAFAGTLVSIAMSAVRRR